MARICTICKHDKREDIDKLLLRNEPLRAIADMYPPLSPSALDRHKTKHLVSTDLAIIQNGQAELHEIVIQDELKKIFSRISKLFDACDEWLRDPDNPEKYDIGSRAEEVMINYSFETDRGKRVRKKAKLSNLLDEIYLNTKRQMGEIELVETKHADPRELTLQTANQLQKQIELLAKLMGMLDDRTQINIALVQSPDWIKIRKAIVHALEPFPRAREAVIAELRNANPNNNII